MRQACQWAPSRAEGTKKASQPATPQSQPTWSATVPRTAITRASRKRAEQAYITAHHARGRRYDRRSGSGDHAPPRSREDDTASSKITAKATVAATTCAMATRPLPARTPRARWRRG